MNVVCPKCKGRLRKNGTNRSEKQRYKCVACGHETVNPDKLITLKEHGIVENPDKLPNILVIADTHIPFEHKDYLAFCKRIYKRYECELVVHIGDVVDNHNINFHEHKPNGMSSAVEVSEALEHLAEWYKAFPNVKVCKGNHDVLPSRRAIREGIADAYFKSFEDMWHFPPGWEFAESFQIKGIKFFHGTGYSGMYPHANAARTEMQSVVIGHLHGRAGVYWIANDLVCIFGLAVGCGIDRRKYAFEYGKTAKAKPILGAGVVTDNGEDARFIRMRLGRAT